MTHQNNSFILAHLDDDPLELKRFERLFKMDPAVKPRDDSGVIEPRDDFHIHSFTHSRDFLKFISKSVRVDFCILDIILSAEEKSDGLSLIQHIKRSHPQCVVVVSSFNDQTDWILKAMALQANDFFSKKLWPHNIPERLMQTRHHFQIKAGLSSPNDLSLTSHDSVRPHDFYSQCAGKTLKSIVHRVPLILKSAARCVLIEGESGTGKEVVADIFEHYSKSHGTFVRLNCASLAQNLLESELFGHKKGSFTGAVQDKAGFVEAAHNGFLFLDEVSSLSLGAQAALLRVIENQEVIRLGETHPRKINVRFLCATNVALQELTSKNLFRKDLWQRLCEVNLSLPPLYQRKDEIPELIDFFCTQFKECRYVIDPLAKQVLSTLDWRDGNVRELRNTLRAMTEFAQNGVLSVGAIPNRIFVHAVPATKPQNTNADITLSLASSTHNRAFTYSELCDELLHQIIQHHVQKKGKLNASRLARELGISRTTLHAKIKIVHTSSPLMSVARKTTVTRK